MFFFFFKQKTAYEVRISDWSSDVCSSDLPVGHAVDLDRLKDQRQAGRGHHHVGGQLVALEDLHAAGLHVGGGDVDLQMRAGAHLLEVDHRLQQVTQRIEVQRIELVGRGDAAQQVEQQVDGRGIEVPVAHEDVDRRAAQRDRKSTRLNSSH